MILIIHIVIALSSVINAVLTYIKPTDTKLKISNWLIGLTVTSGTVLIISSKANLVRSCITGLLFVGFSLVGVVAARHKLAAERSITD